MNQPISVPDIFGQPQDSLANLVNAEPQALAFSSSVDELFNPIGAQGVPDPVASPMECYRYLDARRSVIVGAAKQAPLIRLADKNLNPLTVIGQEREASFEELMADAGQARVVLRFQHWLSEHFINGVSINEDLHLLIDPVPTAPTVNGVTLDWQLRWGGKITEISITNDPDGTSSITIQALSHRAHPKYLLFGSSVWFPPEVQPDKMWILPGPLRSISFVSVFVNLARLFVPGLSFITNAFNPAAYLNPLSSSAFQNVSPLDWPIQVAFVDPARDNSMWSILAATWTTMHDTQADLLSNAGCICRAYTWLPTDATSPHTELVDLLTAGGDILAQAAANLGLSGVSDLLDMVEGDVSRLARPTRPCVVLSYEDKSGINGPTGTAVDGLLELVGVTLDDLITTVVFDQNNEQFVNGEEVIDVQQVTPLFQALLGVETTLPKVVWREGQFSGLVRNSTNLHKGPPKTIMTGGRSPTLVNELQTFGIRYALAELSMVPTLSAGETWGGPANFSPQVPSTPGLDNIYQGQLDNCVAGDTIIDSPDGDERIDVLARRGCPFRVWSVTPDGQRVAATATLAFRKGSAELYEYLLDDGRSISATHEHRFLTSDGFVRGANVCTDTLLATVDHDALSGYAYGCYPEYVNDELYKAVPSTAAVKYRRVVSIKPQGTHDFYDMHVPGWENYSANGIWSHNTLLAWERYTDPLRALYTGDCSWQEYIERGTSTAYGLSGFLSLAEGHYKTRPFYGFTATWQNGIPWVYGVDFQIGDRAAFEQSGVLYVDQVSAIKQTWNRTKPIFADISVGDDRDKHDPVAQGLRMLQGVYALVGAVAGEGTLFG